MSIRKWSCCDNLAIAELERICFSDAWTYDMISQTSSEPSFCGFVSEESGRIVGYVGAVYSCDVADIALIAVHPDYRRRGIAFELLKNAESELMKFGIKNLFLEVRKSNATARSLYLKFGFIDVGERKKYYENTEDAIVMLKVLQIE